MDSTEFGACFWVTITGVGSTLLGLLTLYFLRSKCKKCVLCWGLISVDRDTDNETKEDIEMMEHGMNPYETNNNTS